MEVWVAWNSRASVGVATKTIVVSMMSMNIPHTNTIATSHLYSRPKGARDMGEQATRSGDQPAWIARPAGSAQRRCRLELRLDVLRSHFVQWRSHRRFEQGA